MLILAWIVLLLSVSMMLGFIANEKCNGGSIVMGSVIFVPSIILAMMVLGGI